MFSIDLFRFQRIYITLHLIIAIRSQVIPFPIFVIFVSRQCVGRGCTVILCKLIYVYPKKIGFYFHCYRAKIWCVQMIGYIMVLKSDSFTGTLRPLSQLFWITWKHWSHAILVMYIMSIVCLRWIIFSSLCCMPVRCHISKLPFNDRYDICAGSYYHKLIRNTIP